MMARRPDYSTDYNLTTGHGRRAPAVVRLFMKKHTNMNDRPHDYRSRYEECSHLGSREKSFPSNGITPSDYYTTFKIIKKIKGEKVGLARVTRARGSLVVEART